MVGLGLFVSKDHQKTRGQRTKNVESIESFRFLREHYSSRKGRVAILCDDPNSSFVALVVHTVLTLLVGFSIIIMWMNSLHGPNKNSTNPDFPDLLSQNDYETFELIITVFFTFEFCVRLAVSDSLWVRYPGQSSSPFGRDILNFFDLLAILPFYFEKIVGDEGNLSGTEQSALKLVRLFRTLRCFKVARHFKGTKVMVTALKTSYAPLILPMLFFFLSSLIFGAVLLFFEPCMDVDSCVFTDVFNAAYFAIVSMTTVGYGDQVPQEPISRFVAIFIMLFGAFFLSMPLAVIGNEFGEASKMMEAKDDPLNMKIAGQDNVVHIMGLTRRLGERYLNEGCALNTVMEKIEELKTYSKDEPEHKETLVKLRGSLKELINAHASFSDDMDFVQACSRQVSKNLEAKRARIRSAHNERAARRVDISGGVLRTAGSIVAPKPARSSEFMAGAEDILFSGEFSNRRSRITGVVTLTPASNPPPPAAVARPQVPSAIREEAEARSKSDAAGGEASQEEKEGEGGGGGARGVD